MATLAQGERPFEYAMIAGGSTTEAIGGAVAVVLAILGISQIVPDFMVSIALIVLGVALLSQSGTVVAEYERIVGRSEVEGSWRKAELGGELGIEVIAGSAAVVLGILALLGIHREVLVSVGTIVLGAGVLLGSGVMARLNEMRDVLTGPRSNQAHLAHAAVSTTTAVQVLVALSAIVLGILALIGIDPRTLNLVAQLAMGASILFSGAAVTGRMLTLFRA